MLFTDLHDVQDVKDPLSRVKPGLVADKAQGLVELKAVHVRAKLVDLAAQVRSVCVCVCVCGCVCVTL